VNVPRFNFEPSENPASASTIATPAYDDKDGHYIVTPNDTLGKYCTLYRIFYLTLVVCTSNAIRNVDRVVELLGQGTFGKVAKCLDRRRGNQVAVKIVRAIQKYREASLGEIRVLRKLQRADPENRHRCIVLETEFDFRNHKCMVFPLLGPSLFDYLKDNQFQPFTLYEVQIFTSQILDSVAFLHSLDIVHTDLKPENILLLSAESTQTTPRTQHVHVSRRVHAKQYPHQKQLRSLHVKIIDFGSATFNTEYHSSVVSTRHYRAPEIILEIGWSFPCDLWSVGCILVELLIGEALFQTHENLEHLAMMEVILGYFPESFVCRTRKRTSWFFPSIPMPPSPNHIYGQYKPTISSTMSPPSIPNICKVQFPTAETKRDAKNFVRSLKSLPEILNEPSIVRLSSPPDQVAFLDLVQGLLTYDPTTRLTAQKSLLHPFVFSVLTKAYSAVGMMPNTSYSLSPITPSPFQSPSLLPRAHGITPTSGPLSSKLPTSRENVYQTLPPNEARYNTHLKQSKLPSSTNKSFTQSHMYEPTLVRRALQHQHALETGFAVGEEDELSYPVRLGKNSSNIELGYPPPSSNHLGRVPGVVPLLSEANLSPETSYLGPQHISPQLHPNVPSLPSSLHGPGFTDPASRTASLQGLAANKLSPAVVPTSFPSPLDYAYYGPPGHTPLHYCSGSDPELPLRTFPSPRNVPSSHIGLPVTLPHEYGNSGKFAPGIQSPPDPYASVRRNGLPHYPPSLLKSPNPGYAPPAEMELPHRIPPGSVVNSNLYSNSSSSRLP
jgi:dual-specificity kinase